MGNPSSSRFLSRCLYLAGSLFVLGPLASCRSVEQTTGGLPFDRGWPPFYEEYDTPSSIGAASGSEVFFRPFGSLEQGQPDDFEKLKLLLPVVDFTWAEKETLYKVLPIFLYRKRLKEFAGTDVDWMLFPLLYYGSDSDEGDYFAVFPFGGKLRGLIGYDEIDFVLFPAYVHLRRKEKHSVLAPWPLINVVWGGGWSGWRFLPFYGNYSWDDRHGRPRRRREFILWPFYISQQEYLLSTPTNIFFSFPFYGVRENERSVTETYLWPLFVTHYDKTRQETLVGGFFFPYRFGEDQFDPWPFWGEKVRAPRVLTSPDREYYRQYFLWPIQRYEWGRDAVSEMERLWIMPFFWHFSYVHEIQDRSETRWTLWPLLGYREKGAETRVDLLFPLPLNREDYYRHYGRWFAFFRYLEREEYLAWELLYGTLYWHTTPEESILSLLGGLLELGSGEDGFIFRILYVVPWW